MSTIRGKKYSRSGVHSLGVRKGGFGESEMKVERTFWISLSSIHAIQLSLYLFYQQGLSVWCVSCWTNGRKLTN